MNPDSQNSRQINLNFALRSGRAGAIEFWRDNGDGTCARLHDNLTLTYRKYEALLSRPHRRSVRPGYDRLRWEA